MKGRPWEQIIKRKLKGEFLQVAGRQLKDGAGTSFRGDGMDGAVGADIRRGFEVLKGL